MITSSLWSSRMFLKMEVPAMRKNVSSIYVFILTVHNAKKFLSLQISQTSQAISTEFNNMLRNQTNARKRKKVINEIFATEKTYQDHLHAVTSVSIHWLHFIVTVAFTFITLTCHLRECQVIKACEIIYTVCFKRKCAIWNFSFFTAIPWWQMPEFFNANIPFNKAHYCDNPHIALSVC